MSKLIGDSQNDDGVVGIAHISGKSGVFGFNKHNGGNGVAGISEAGNGVYARSNSFNGIYGTSSTGSGVHGRSDSSNGIYGTSSTGSGVHGHSKAQFGVFAVSEADTGVFARGPKFAGYFDGNVGVARLLTVQGVDVIGEINALKAKKGIDQSALEQASLKIGLLEKMISDLQLRLTALEQVAHTHSD